MDASEIYGPHKTHCNRLVHRSRMDVFCLIFEILVGEGPQLGLFMIVWAATMENAVFPLAPQHERQFFRAAALRGYRASKAHSPST